MNSQNPNPFVLPGIGQGGELGQNTLMASMEMMRQAWQNLASTGALTQPAVAAPLSVDDLDRRIADLRAVENWLRLNMSMLSSSIQALEVQRATVATIKSFLETPAEHDPAHNPSPLEVALGLKPSGQARIKGAKDKDAKEPPSASDAGANPALAGAPLSEAAQGWWNMLQKQFDTLAAATTASLQATAENAQAQSQAADKPAKKKSASAVKSQAGDVEPKPAPPRRRTSTASKSRSSTKRS